MNKDQIMNILQKNGYSIVDDIRITNNYGDVLTLNNGCIVNCYDKGTYSCQGKNIDEVKKILKTNSEPTKVTANKKVFVVYGHDQIARTQLEAMLRRWDLEPLILDQQVTSGQTIIEKLEEYTTQVGFGIVLATPDDIGYAKKKESEKKYRVRQNVILEMGMLLSAIGRSKVAILLSTSEDMESPSDIQGLIYIPFKDNVEEVNVSLAKEMKNNGYYLDISKL